MALPKKQSQFIPTAAMVAATQDLLLAMAYRDTVKPIVEAYKLKVMLECSYHPAPEYTQCEGRRREEDVPVLDPDQSYLLSDANARHIYDRFNQERDAAGFTNYPPDHCPFLCADSAVIQAKHRLITAMEPATGMTGEQIWNTSDALGNMEKLIEIILKLMVRFIDKNAILTTVRTA